MSDIQVPFRRISPCNTLSQIGFGTLGTGFQQGGVHGTSFRIFHGQSLPLMRSYAPTMMLSAARAIQNLSLVMNMYEPAPVLPFLFFFEQWPEAFGFGWILGTAAFS